MQRKWRPSLKTLVALVVATLMALPLIGLFTARLTSDQFIQETESSLISQAAVFSQVYADAYAEQNTQTINAPLLPAHLRKYYALQFHPKPALLTTKNTTILDQRPSPAPQTKPIDPAYLTIGERLSRIATQAQKTSLAGYQALDLHGNIIGGTGALQGSFAHISEVSRALKGERVSVLRDRSDKRNRHPLASISRDTGFRVFVTMPVIVDERIVGAVYLTRTPSNLGKFLIREGKTLLLTAGSILLAAFVVGFVLWRLLAGPINELKQQSQKVARGQMVSLTPMAHYGTKELADLGQSVLSMSTKLNQRSTGIQTYTAHVTHELKSPLTSIVGAVELLQQSGKNMDLETRSKFYDNIQKDGQRMTRLLDELRSFAAASLSETGDDGQLSKAVENLRAALPDIAVKVDGDEMVVLPIAQNDLDIILVQLGQNAQQQGADQINILSSDSKLVIRDNGRGISNANIDKIFEPFFTTNRDNGGTGMGLAIVKNTLDNYGAKIQALPHDAGAQFEIVFNTVEAD